MHMECQPDQSYHLALTPAPLPFEEGRRSGYIPAASNSCVVQPQGLLACHRLSSGYHLMDDVAEGAAEDTATFRS